MGCIIRECKNCGYADGELPPRGFSRYKCPECGSSMSVSFDEEGMHDPEPSEMCEED